MSNIKNLNNIIKALTDTDDETFAAIIDNEMVDVETLTNKDKLCVLVFDALRKGIDTKAYNLILDCNFARSGFHNHKDPADDIYKVDYYRVVPASSPTNALIHIYTKPSRNADAISFSVSVSSKEDVRSRIEDTEALDFHIVRNKTTDRIKDYYMPVDYENLVSVIKTLLAILAETNKEREAIKAEKKAAKKDEKKDEKKEEKKEMTVEEMVQTITEALNAEEA